MESKKEDKKTEEAKESNELEQSKKQLEEKNKRIEELTDTLKRLQAEFENFKKRVDKEKLEFVKYAHADIIAEMLPVLDSFELALKSTKIEDVENQGFSGCPRQSLGNFRDAKNPKDFLANTTNTEKLIEGIKMIYAQFYSTLEAEGLKPIKATGEKFNPYKHEVLMKEESDKPEDTILEEFQKGYMLNDRVLRHSKVKVSGK